MCSNISPTSKMSAEIQMRSGHLFWSKYRQTTEAIDLQALFNEYWSSKKHEFTLQRQSCPPTSPLMSDREGQTSLSLENIVGLLNCDSLQPLLFVSFRLPIQIN